MAWLFDTDAISEVMKPRPAAAYVEWLLEIPREDQYTSAVCIGELYYGAMRLDDGARHLAHIRRHVLPLLTVLPFDVAVASEYGKIRARLDSEGKPLPDADLQIAATACYHGLRLVTGNLKHFERIADLQIEPVLATSRRS